MRNNMCEKCDVIKEDYMYLTNHCNNNVNRTVGQSKETDVGNICSSRADPISSQNDGTHPEMATKMTTGAHAHE